MMDFFAKDTAIAIDPENCACTECLDGLYVPFNKATAAQFIRMINGDMKNNTGYDNVKDLLDAIEENKPQTHEEVTEFVQQAYPEEYAQLQAQQGA